MSTIRNFERGAFLILLLLASANYTSAQIFLPSTLNASGSTVNKGYYSFDWSIGESTAVSTLTNGNAMLT